MGKFLRAALGQDLFTIGSAIGSVPEAIPPSAVDSASIDMLSRIASGPFVVDLQRSRGLPLRVRLALAAASLAGKRQRPRDHHTRDSVRRNPVYSDAPRKPISRLG
jgi:hypothetical protein